MRKEEKFINLAPKAIRVAVKAIRFARGGFDDNEKAELGEDLWNLLCCFSLLLQKHKKKSNKKSQPVG